MVRTLQLTERNDVLTKGWNPILKEALSCRTCTNMPVTRDMMEADIACNRYRFAADPPFSIDTDDDIPPDEMPPERWQPGYRRYATAAQQERYLQQVRQVLLPGGGSGDVERDVQFAFYCVDYHIHQHCLARRSPMNLCRTVGEMRDVQLCQLQMENMKNKVVVVNACNDVSVYNDVDMNTYDADINAYSEVDIDAYNVDNAYTYDTDIDPDAPPPHHHSHAPNRPRQPQHGTTRKSTESQSP